MIKRIVLLKVKDNNRLEEIIEKSRDVLPGITYTQTVEVCVVKDNNAFDLALIMEFANMSDVKSFGIDKVHRDYVDNFLKPLLADIVAYNLECSAEIRD